MVAGNMVRSVALVLVLTLLITPFGVLPGGAAPVAAEEPTLANAVTLPPERESEPNDEINSPTPPANQSDRIGPPLTNPVGSWRQRVTGAITSTDDLDWFGFRLTEPASTVVITLTDLPEDYDLVLVSSAETTNKGDTGLENILDIGGRARNTGGRARNTGGRARNTGGRARNTGGTLTAIGGRARNTGGDIAAYSSQALTETEVIDTILWLPGTYYIVVAGHNGVFSRTPYRLQVEVNGSGLAATPQPGPFTFNPAIVEPDPTRRTLFVLDTDRMKAVYPQAEQAVTQILSRTLEMAALPEVAGVVVDMSVVDNRDVLLQAYDTWDAEPSNPFYANFIAETIDSAITAATIRNPSGGQEQFDPPFPNIKYIVLVGGDAVLPFYRVPDFATVANESEYLPYLNDFIEPQTGIIDPDSALGGALRYRTILTDDIYGDDEPYQLPAHPLYVPDRAVGRLVESPADILAYLEQYVPEGGFTGGVPFVIDASGGGAVVTGYDFLIDQAQAVTAAFAAMGFVPPVLLRTLIDDSWNTDDLKAAWFDDEFAAFSATGTYTTQAAFPLQSINGHFDHWEAIPADESQTPFLSAQEIRAPQPEANQPLYFENRLCYSVGCHSGLNVEETALLPDVDADAFYNVDFPQAFLAQGGNWIGNTGYGYGDADLVGYSERLSLFFTREIGRNVTAPDVDDSDGDGDDTEQVYVGQTIGAALARSKQQYIRNATYLDVHDIKSLMVMTLYGLPFLRVKVPEPLPFPAEEAVPAPPPADVDVPDSGLVERLLTFRPQIDANGVITRTGNNYPILIDLQIEDRFVTTRTGLAAAVQASDGRIIDAVQEGFPELPEFSYDLSLSSSISDASSLVVRDVVFVGGEYTVQDYTPQVSQIITQDIEFLQEEVNFGPDADGEAAWYPDHFYDVTRTNVQTGTDIVSRSQLVITPAVYKPVSDSAGRLRIYEELTFKVIYVDPNAVQAEQTLSDSTAPIIDNVRAISNASIGAPSHRVAVKARDDTTATADLLVEGVYLENGTTWLPLNFSIGSVDDLWITEVPTELGATNYIISVRDKAGNVASYTGKGRLSVPTVAVLSGATIDGPADITVGSTAAFTATLATVGEGAIEPILYTWEPEPDTGQGTEAVTYTFDITGTQQIGVTIENRAGSVNSTRSISVTQAGDPGDPVDPGDQRLYLPLVER
jgi:hypothetical protein